MHQSPRALLLFGMGLAACMPFVEYRSATMPEPAPQPAYEPVRILSVSLVDRSAPVAGHVDPAAEANEPAKTDPASPSPTDPVPMGTLLVVFSEELDPSTVEAAAFTVSLRDGRRLLPEAAVLSPASEGDENRSVSLEGAFGDRDNPPVAVHVRGRVYAESGAPSRGAGGPVRGFDDRDSMVAAESRPVDERSCPGAQGVVRTYWSDHLRGVELDDLSRVAVVLRGVDAGAGIRTHPVGFDDHETEDESREDNVLDLCLDVGQPVARVEVAAAAFHDRGGRPTASAGLDVRGLQDPGEQQ